MPPVLAHVVKQLITPMTGVPSPFKTLVFVDLELFLTPTAADSPLPFDDHCGSLRLPAPVLWRFDA